MEYNGIQWNSMEWGGIIYFDFVDDVPGGFEFLERLTRRDGVDHDERVTLGDVEPLHGRELVRSCRVRYLQRAHVVLVACYHLGRINFSR